MKDIVVLRVVSKLLIPYILLFGLYVQMHGDYGPGGGFQAGVIFAAAFILYGLIFGTASIRSVMPRRILLGLISLGVLLYAGTGVAALILGGNFLDYNALAADPLKAFEFAAVPGGMTAREDRAAHAQYCLSRLCSSTPSCGAGAATGPCGRRRSSRWWAPY